MIKTVGIALTSCRGNPINMIVTVRNTAEDPRDPPNPHLPQPWPSPSRSRRRHRRRRPVARCRRLRWGRRLVRRRWRGGQRHAQPRLLPQRHACAGARRCGGGPVRRGARRRRRAEHVHLQRRHGGHRGAVRRGDRHHLHRPEPGDQRVRPERRHRHPHHLRQHVRRRLPRREAGDHLGRAARGAHHRHALARQHPGRRAARVARGERPRDHARRRRRRLDPAAVERRPRWTPSSAARSTAPGCPSRGRPA